MANPERLNYYETRNFEKLVASAILQAYQQFPPQERAKIDRASENLQATPKIGRLLALEILAKVGMFLDGVQTPSSSGDLKKPQKIETR